MDVSGLGGADARGWGLEKDVKGMATKIERLAEVQRKRLMVSSLPTTFALALFTNIYNIVSIRLY